MTVFWNNQLSSLFGGTQLPGYGVYQPYSGKPISGPGLGWHGDYYSPKGSTPKAETGPVGSSYTSGGSGAVLGASTTNNGGTDLFGEWSKLSEQQRTNDINTINTNFDKTNAQGQQNLSQLGTQYEAAKTGLSTALEGVKTTVGNAVTSAKESAQYETNKALSTAQDVVKQNRNALRSLGILASTAAGELLQKPMTEFGQQAYELGVSLTGRVKELDDYLVQKTDEAAAKLSELENNYLGLVGNIQNDLRFNEEQRANAIASANTALQGRITDIAQAVMQFNQTVETNKMNLANQIAQLMLYQNPQANVQSILGTAYNTAGQYVGNQATAITPEKKKDIYGNVIG